MTLRNLRLFPPLLPPEQPGPDLGAPGSRRRLVLIGAALTVVTEICFLTGVAPEIEMGGLDLSMAVIPALALGAACGDRLVGRSSLRRVATWYWLGTCGLLIALSAVYLFGEGFELFAALVVAALGEELIYRLAAPAVFAVLLKYGGLSNRRARLAGLAAAGAWFVLLPGHHDQMDSGAGPLPFVAYAIFSAALVYRSGSILPMAMAHAIVNLVTVLVWDEVLPADARAISATAVLGLLTLAYGMQRRVAKDAHGHLIDTITGLEVVEVEEVDGVQVARLTDGTLVPLEGS
jgi:membrane protease YdiL (CAAX protease family)